MEEAEKNSLAAIKRSAMQGDAADVLSAFKGSGQLTAGSNARRFTQQVGNSLTSLQEKIKTAARKGDFEVAYQLAMETEALRRKYETQWQPLVNMLGYRKAAEFWEARSNPG